MPSCGEGARTGQHLVDRAVVDASGWLLSVVLGQQPDQRELGVQLLRVRLVQEMCLVVPTGAFHVHAIDEATIFGRLSDRRGSSVVAHLEVKAQLVNSDLHLTRIVLQCTREESLREEEA